MDRLAVEGRSRRQAQRVGQRKKAPVFTEAFDGAGDETRTLFWLVPSQLEKIRVMSRTQAQYLVHFVPVETANNNGIHVVRARIQIDVLGGVGDLVPVVEVHAVSLFHGFSHVRSKGGVINRHDEHERSLLDRPL